ncbi:DUF6734 family protein [Dyella subtropica]|uniref:DUF6734 family protein n=1 Tax=Dyella subtropica TaxID=2992127 RepID=UPI00225A9055|nr:DUF6734 family protein [Dyella subtropica]
MRAVWSFWSKPFFAHKGRIWREPRHHLLAWGLSLRLARRHYPETMLVTDKAGKALLVDRLGLDFDEVSIELEALRDADLGWWALGKLYAYSMQDRPFIHLDTDVFLWKPLPASVASAPVFAQCPEDHPLNDWCGPQDIEAAFAKHRLPLPQEWEWMRSQPSTGFREENCGILGGHHVDFIRYYAQLGMDLAVNPAFAQAWAELPNKSGYNMMIEQFLLSACLDYHRAHPESPYQGIRIKHLFPSFGDAFNPRLTAQAGYTHLLGNAKSHAGVMQRLEQRMQQEDRSFYNRCLRMEI